MFGTFLCGFLSTEIIFSPSLPKNFAFLHLCYLKKKEAHMYLENEEEM